MSLAPLSGFVVGRRQDASSAAAFCARHLSLLGAAEDPRGSHLIWPIGEGAVDILSLESRARSEPPLEVRIAWPEGVDGAAAAGAHEAVGGMRAKLNGSADHVPPAGAGEALAQALCGLMSVHGREGGVPRRLGLEVVSAAAGLLAIQGVLAALLARRRGRAVSSVRVSPLGAGTLFISQHIAAATGAASWPVVPDGPAGDPGPPFASAEGVWVELEMLSPASWRDFWTRLGVDQTTIASSWLPFAIRHSTARCSLPPQLHEASESCRLDELRAIADDCGAGLVRIRSHAEVMSDLRRPNGAVTIPPPWRARAAPVGDASPARGAAPSDQAEVGPLAGMRVLEATTRVQGPLAGQLLRMLGAEVTRIEPPGGDPGRISASTGGPVASAHAAYNRGKRSCEVDYRDAGGREAILDLAASSDVFLHNWRSGRAAELRLDAADMHVHNPALVYANASGWGPYAKGLPPVATEYLVQAHMGVGELVAIPGELPFPSRVTLVDVAGALVAVEAVLAALLERERTGRGTAVETSLVSGALELQRARIERASEQGSMAGQRGEGDGPLAWSKRGDRGVPPAAVCRDLTSLRDQPPEPGLLEPVDGGCWAPAPPWRFT